MNIGGSLELVHRLRTSMRTRMCLFARVVVLLFVVAADAHAEGFQGGIRGARDAGVVVPAAEVTVTNESTNTCVEHVVMRRAEHREPQGLQPAGRP